VILCGRIIVGGLGIPAWEIGFPVGELGLPDGESQWGEIVFPVVRLLPSKWLSQKENYSLFQASLNFIPFAPAKN
jgi:hypothetical protein